MTCSVTEILIKNDFLILIGDLSHNYLIISLINSTRNGYSITYRTKRTFKCRRIYALYQNTTTPRYRLPYKEHVFLLSTIHFKTEMLHTHKPVYKLTVGFACDTMRIRKLNKLLILKAVLSTYSVHQYQVLHEYSLLPLFGK